MQAVAQSDPEALYADRAHLASARQAADIWGEILLTDPRRFEPAWKLSRVLYWLGHHAPASERRALLERAIQAADTARDIEPNRPEGHFWAAAAMGAIAENYGLRVGLKYRKPIKESLERVLALDAAFMNGSADRALGRWYHKVPGLFGGSRKRAEAHLRASLRYDPTSVLTHFFLGELFLDDGRKADAREAFETAIRAPINPAWAPEDEDYKRQARERLARLD